MLDELLDDVRANTHPDVIAIEVPCRTCVRVGMCVDICIDICKTCA